MKYIFTAFITSAVLWGCSGPKEILYNYPPYLKENQREEFVRTFEKGYVLYEVHCAKCHSKFEGKYELIPDFTQQQLDVYNVRTGLAKHEETLSSRNIPEEELELVMTFLEIKKAKTPFPASKSKKIK